MYKIIRFTPDSKWYYYKSLDLGTLMDTKDYTDHTRVDFPLGSSRIGGPIVDLPDHLSYPKDMYFAAQLKLSDFSKHDPLKLLPKTGFLYFFIGDDGDTGRVFYADVTKKSLKRYIKGHDRWFYDGCLIKDIFYEEEDFSPRWSKELIDTEFEYDDSGWDYFAGSEKSKIYGIYTHCQKHAEEIMNITDSEDALLLQVGEDFTDEGVWSVLINRQDLRNKLFQNCTFEWGQS
jgi:uncharacterized protein YwqG